MNDMRIHGTHHLAALGVVVALTAGLAVAGTAQTVSGQAFSTYVNTSVASSIQSPLVVLPAVSGTDGAEADAEGAGVTVANTLSSDFLNSITSGELDTSAAGAQSTASAADINVLNGLITADEVIANATSSRTGSGAVSNADGSTFQNLVVAGVALTTGDGPVAPNTTIALSGVGYVVLNEQTLSGDGVTTSGITVNMIHVYLQSALGGPTGEIIVGSATTSVGS